MIRTLVLTATLSATLVVPAQATAPATVQAPERATRAPHVQTLAAGLVTPLSLAVTRSGTRFFSTNFAGGLYRQRPGGRPVPVHRAGGGTEVGAVSERRGTVAFATTGKRSRTRLWRMSPGKAPTVVANLGRYEKQNNPDGAVTYGFQGLDPACAALVPKKTGPATYTGVVESHPYATTMTGTRTGMTTYVADAAANAVLAVSRSGRVSTVAVLPPVPVVITGAAAAANKIPACAIGSTYLFEPVPTDVEEGPDGMLYVSSLPGGPEDGSTGAHGSVVTIEPGTGAVTLVAGGLLSPVGVAVAGNGDVFVSQLFGGAISRIRHGSTRATSYAAVPLPGAVELAGGALYATTGVLPGKPTDDPTGALVRIAR